MTSAGVTRSELEFSYPEDLLATEPVSESRVLWHSQNSGPVELKIEELLEKIAPGDLLVVNDTRVLARRVFTKEGLEILFLQSSDRRRWQVLMPLQKLKKRESFALPDQVSARVVERGRPQLIETSEPLDEKYFETHGELPLPPYIQKARGERRPREQDRSWYQTAWAERPGSLAAPTASLHFRKEHLQRLKERGVHLGRVTLHVGLGTFLEIANEDLSEHQMHFEEAEVSGELWQQVESVRRSGGRVWALGTTVVRTLESVTQNLLKKTDQGGYRGETDLFISPGFRFEVVDVLLTNFHQPRSTLLALVGAFAGLDRVKQAYAWAIEKQFRLFSYGDLTAWEKYSVEVNQ